MGHIRPMFIVDLMPRLLASRRKLQGMHADGRHDRSSKTFSYVPECVERSCLYFAYIKVVLRYPIPPTDTIPRLPPGINLYFWRCVQCSHTRGAMLITTNPTSNPALPLNPKVSNIGGNQKGPIKHHVCRKKPRKTDTEEALFVCIWMTSMTSRKC